MCQTHAPRQHETAHKRAHQSPMIGATRSLHPSKAQHDFGILDNAVPAGTAAGDLGVEILLVRAPWRREI